MRIHIFQFEHLYVRELLNYLQANFDLRGHLFIFPVKPGSEIPDKERLNILYKPGLTGFMNILSRLGKADRIYFHMLPMGPYILLWSIFPKLFKKAVWIYWGSDVYVLYRRFRNLKHFIYHLCRKRIIARLPYIAGYLKGDYDLVLKFYKTTAEYRQVIYPIPTNIHLIDHILKDPVLPRDDTYVVLLGNSGNPSNDHSGMLRIMEIFKEKNIELICPVSYGASKNYVDRLIKTGSAVFGPKIRFLQGLLTPEEYIRLLTGVDIAIMNHKRQQGLGNILTMLYMGKKVYLDPDTTSYAYLVQKGIRIFNTRTITNRTFDDFIHFDRKSGIINKKIIGDELSEEHYRSVWKNILEL